MKEYSYLKRVKMGVEKLKLGMYVGKLDKSWQESPFLFQGFPIEDEEQLELLKKECRFVFVDFKTQEEYDVFLLNAGSEVDITTSEDDTPLVEELPKALLAFEDALKSSKLFMRRAQQGNELDLTTINQAVTNCIASLHRNEQALLILSNSKNEIHYTAEHASRVAILSLAFGGSLGMSHEQLHLLGVSAMLHDVGKAAIPAKILHKSEKLTAEEIRCLREHPKNSYKILSAIEGISDVIKEVALSHHEREDGRGYPRHIPKDRVSRYAKIVSMIDAYDAITSDRLYSKGRSPSTAFKILNKSIDSKFEGELVNLFIKWIGIMPLGALVEMKTGEVGIVLKNYPDQKLRPRVMLVRDELKKAGYQKIIDLSKMETHSNGEPYQIKMVLPPRAHGIDIKRYLDEKNFEVPKWCKSVEIDDNSPFAKYLSQ